MVPSDTHLNDDLTDWIAGLKNRLNRGDLAAHPPIDVGYGTERLPAEQTVRIMLADLDGFDDLPHDVGNDPSNSSRRCGLLDDFRRLRDLIG